MSDSGAQARDKHTGSAADSRWPQSSTSPVILPAANRERRWLEANDMEGTCSN